MKASVIDKYVISFPKEENAPMLFLEWLTTRGKCSLYSIRQNKELSLFIVRLHTENIGQDCVEYINANLSK